MPLSKKPLDQACVVPFRRNGSSVEYCLITSLKRKNWIFPKGIVDPGETLEETGLKEAHEEAGLHGEVVGDPIGNYADRKWGCHLNVTVLLMEVQQADAEWLEAHLRQRDWVPFETALKKLGRAEHVECLKKAHQRLAESGGA